MSRNLVRTALLVAAMGGLGVAPAAAQRRQGPNLPRLFVSAFAGRYTNTAGFNDQNSFFRFDDAMAYGGSVRFRPGQGALYGVDVVYLRPSYSRYEDSILLSNGDATALATMASVRLTSSGGLDGVYLTGAVGAVSWDVEELGDRDTDPAFTVGIGVDYGLRGNAALFGEYDQWWVFHQKEESGKKNTAGQTLLRVGLRYGF